MYYAREKVGVPAHLMEHATALVNYNFSKLDKSLKYLLSFSCGKDSVCLLDLATKNGFKPIVYFQYIIDDLSYNKAVVDYFESKGVKINKIESGMVAKMQIGDLLCINKVWNIKSGKWNPLEKTERVIKQIVEFDYNMLGIKQTDSPNRRMVINKYGWIQPNVGKVYPIFHLTDRLVWKYLYDNDLPVNKCYEMFGRSQDVINYAHLKPLETSCPDDLKRFIHKFPLIETLFWIKAKRSGATKQKFFKFTPWAKKGNEWNYSVDLDRFLILAFDDHEEKEKWCTAYLDNAYAVYIEGSFYGLEKESFVIVKTKKERKETHTLTEDTLRFQSEKIEMNNLDNFLILVFDNKSIKEDFCLKHLKDKDVNAVDGLEYKIV